MKLKRLRVVGLLAVAMVSATPSISQAAGQASHRLIVSPKPMTVYVGSRLVASGQSLSGGIGKVRSMVPFTIITPRYLPTGYTPLQLAVTPQQRGISNGVSVLTYAFSSHGVVSNLANGFVIIQMATPFLVVRASSVTTATVGSWPATVEEFKLAKSDQIFITWTDAAGHGYQLTTDAAASHLSTSVLLRIASSLN